MKKITAKFNSTCAETGAKIKKGDQMYYDYSARKCYAMNSERAKNEESAKDDGMSGFIQAEQEQYFDNFCYNNNI